MFLLLFLLAEQFSKYKIDTETNHMDKIIAFIQNSAIGF